MQNFTLHSKIEESNQQHQVKLYNHVWNIHIWPLNYNYNFASWTFTPGMQMSWGSSNQLMPIMNQNQRSLLLMPK